AEIRAEIIGDDLGVLAGYRRAALLHVGDDDRPRPLAALDRDHALEVVAERATARDQILAGPVRQRDRFGWRQIYPWTEMNREIGHNGVDLGLGQLRTAQHHVVDIAPPADGAVADLGDGAERMSLGAGDR